MARRFKLRKTDLPEALKYSRERFWALEFPNGTIRIGLTLPAIQDEPPGVYFFHSRTSGYIQTGKKFGFVDLDSGRFDLVAPISGRIARINPKLASDPGLIAVDGFGEGWIVELTRVLPQALTALLDRDSFYGWLKFEREARRLGLEPTVAASHRIVSGEPWPQDIVFRFGGKVVLRSRPVRLGRNETFTPQWVVGQKWKVRTEFEQPSMAMVANPGNENCVRTFEYEVIEEFADVGGETCWQVKVTELEGPPVQKYVVLSIARGDFSLRLIEEVNAHDPRNRSRLPNDWGAEVYIELRRPRELIVDLPLFPAENRDERREVAVGEEPKVVVEARFEPKRMLLSMQADPGRGSAIRSEQVWEAGLPWWKEARRTAGERVLIKGELVGA